jgi:hypothetical protein
VRHRWRTLCADGTRDLSTWNGTLQRWETTIMDDLADCYQSWPGPRFAHIDVERCLHAVPWPMEECVPRVTSKGLERKASLRKEYPFNALGFLQLSLFGCPPFLGLTERQIKNAKPHVPPSQRLCNCPHRQRLLNDLAAALSYYEAGRHLSDSWPALAEVLHQGRVACQQMESMLTELRRRQIPLTNQTLRHRSTASQIKMLRGVADLFTAFEAADYYHTGGSASTHVITRFLLWMMADALRTHVPTFTQEAIHYALAAILKPLGIYNERGKPWTAAGIKGLFRRHSPMAIIKDYARFVQRWCRETMDPEN